MDVGRAYRPPLAWLIHPHTSSRFEHDQIVNRAAQPSIHVGQSLALLPPWAGKDMDNNDLGRQAFLTGTVIIVLSRREWNQGTVRISLFETVISGLQPLIVEEAPRFQVDQTEIKDALELSRVVESRRQLG